MGIATGLVPLALSRIADLRGDDAQEAALRLLVRAVNEIPAPPEAVAEAFERILSLSRSFSEPGARARSYRDACEAITVSLLPLSRRRDLLDHALSLALACPDVPERIAAATAVLDARVDVRWGERTEEVLEELGRAAERLTDEEAHARAVLVVATSLAKAGETDRALLAVEALPASGLRALGMARVAFALERGGLTTEAGVLIERALAAAGPSAPSREGALALHAMLAHAVETALDLQGCSALSAALDVADAQGDARARRDAVLAAIALPGTPLDGEALLAAFGRLGASIARVDDDELRVGLCGRLAVSLAALGEVSACLEALREVASLVARLRASGVQGPSVALPVALPVLEILGVLADVDFEPEDLERFAAAALDLLCFVDDGLGVATLLGAMTRVFASPALPYVARVALLDRTLAVAQGLQPDDARVEVVAHVADALSIARATERGDSVSPALICGIGASRAREVRLGRAVALVRLGRTADARAEIAAAAAVTAGVLAIEDLAMTMARCGFLGDMLAALERVDAERQGETRAQLADSLVEATYLDPHLREMGLTSLLVGTAGPVRDTIACLLDQVRVLEGLGDVEAILARAFARLATLADRRAAAIFERQLVDALVERIRAAPQDSAAAPVSATR